MANGPDRSPEKQAAWHRLFEETRSFRSRLLADMRAAGINPGPRSSGLLAFANSPRGQEISRQVTREFKRRDQPDTEEQITSALPRPEN